DLTTEQYRLIYERPIYPKNLYAERAPYTHAEYREEVLEPQVRLLQERGVYARPDPTEEAGDSPDPDPEPAALTQPPSPLAP
ncbi:MAG TPA: hypothetical protein VKB54_11130, partial [Solirubrobacteraceae bacterium]|nr:hypothetical protein [Solirubrobacteraceae bacterium]